ncbi:DarT ssDNA thymidine ADP-ribosyltransferase family protein [Xenorhabdus siamensis]|uniref:DarT ssDNA thymidine ADP-ribosyltransferase family protein n=1 Tax=Xenorhabdus siamensis TaxID=3136254 RepID=UPI0030F47670
MADIKTQKLLYHLTSLNNVSSILTHGLKSRAILGEFRDVADKEIIDSRKEYDLEKYVPFHWFSRNPFDGRVQKDRPDENFILITVKREVAKAENWKVIPQHPLANTAIKLYDYDEGFGLINWDIMNKRDYHNPDCKSHMHGGVLVS